MSSTQADVSCFIHAPECRKLYWLVYSCTKYNVLVVSALMELSGTQANVSHYIHTHDCRNGHGLYPCAKCKTFLALCWWQYHVHKLMFAMIVMTLSVGMDISYYIPVLRARLYYFCFNENVMYIRWCFLLYSCTWVQEWAFLILFMTLSKQVDWNIFHRMILWKTKILEKSTNNYYYHHNFHIDKTLVSYTEFLQQIS